MFLTGGSGFLGARVRDRLRRAGAPFAELPRGAGADLLVPATYERELAGAGTVVHLAAATGKAAPADHVRINRDGTRVLVEQCRRAGVRRFVFVSSIAVSFPDIRAYPYARAKRDAEAIVAASGMDYTIVRPTIIAGPGSPVLTGLRRLATLPVVPVFGPGTARVQPIFVDDLAECLLTIVANGGGDRIVELGGPDVLTIEQLLSELRRASHLGHMRAVHLPLGAVIPVLTLLESVAYRFLPVTVGQLSTFRWDGTAKPNAVFERHRATMTRARRMIELSVAA